MWVIYKLFILNGFSIDKKWSARSLQCNNPEVVGTSAVKKKTGKMKAGHRGATGVTKEVISTSFESEQSRVKIKVVPRNGCDGRLNGIK